MLLSPADRMRTIQPTRPNTISWVCTDSHESKPIGDAYENIRIFPAAMSVIDARGVDDEDGRSADLGLDDTDFTGTRLEAPADFLLLRSDEVDKLFGMRRV